MARVKLGDVAREYKATCGDQKEGLRVVGLEHLIPQQIILTLWDEGKENTFTKMFKKGQVLFGRRRAYLMKAAVAPFDGICSGDITVIEAIPGKILPELLPFIIQNDTLFDFAVERSAGSLSPRVKWEHLKNFEFELPELDRQKELADILWASERAKTAYRELISSTDELVKSQFIEMFGNDTVGWKYSVVPFSTVGVFTTGGTPSQKDSAEYVGNTPWITTVSLGSNYVDESNAIAFISQQAIDESATHLIPKNSLMIGIRVGVGKTSINTVPMCTSQDIVSVHSVSPQFSLLFLKKVVDSYSDYFEENKRGATIKGIPSTMVKEINIPVVDLDIQKRFEQVVLQLDKSKSLCELTARNRDRKSVV